MKLNVYNPNDITYNAQSIQHWQSGYWKNWTVV